MVQASSGLRPALTLANRPRPAQAPAQAAGAPAAGQGAKAGPVVRGLVLTGASTTGVIPGAAGGAALVGMAMSRLNPLFLGAGMVAGAALGALGGAFGGFKLGQWILRRPGQ